MKQEPCHRKCIRPRRHSWQGGRITGTGWTLLRCRHCGEETI